MNLHEAAEEEEQAAPCFCFDPVTLVRLLLPRSEERSTSRFFPCLLLSRLRVKKDEEEEEEEEEEDVDNEEERAAPCFPPCLLLSRLRLKKDEEGEEEEDEADDTAQRRFSEAAESAPNSHLAPLK
jgi:hypothetical protein